MAWTPDNAYLCAGAFYSTIENMIIYAKLQLKESEGCNCTFKSSAAYKIPATVIGAKMMQ